MLCRKHQLQIERGDFSGCLSPTALESAEPFDHIPFGEQKYKDFVIKIMQFVRLIFNRLYL